MLDTDEDLSRALQAAAALAVVRVTTAGRNKAGTRSATAVYQATVERPIEGALPTPLALKHFGEPMLAPGDLYAVAAGDTGRHHGAWELFYATPMTGDAEEADRDLRARVHRLRGL